GPLARGKYGTQLTATLLGREIAAIQAIISITFPLSPKCRLAFVDQLGLDVRQAFVRFRKKLLAPSRFCFLDHRLQILMLQSLRWFRRARVTDEILVPCYQPSRRSTRDQQRPETPSV
ncbi:MAG: hypothetical protein WA867_19740, partial [Candidatus Acidiferrales bacterium]